MQDNDEGLIDREDDLRASNELLKLKLEIDHHMIMGGGHSEIPPEVENEWLKNVYNFEKRYKEAGRAKVYDLLGRPEYSRYDTLSPDQLRNELLRLEVLMEGKNFTLDRCCDYDDIVIYRFITEELFEHETDDFFMEGMVHHFIYEEFHPNHDYDLTRLSQDFLEQIMERKWNDEFHRFYLAETVWFQGKEFPAATVSGILLTFQEAHSSFECEQAQVAKVWFDLETGKGGAEVNMKYVAHPLQGGPRSIGGKGQLQFKIEYGGWSVTGFDLPGITNSEIK